MSLFASPPPPKDLLKILTLCRDNHGMFGPAMNTIFASRWKALWFFGSVMLTAYCSIPDPAEVPADDAAAKQQAEQVAQIVKSLQNSRDNLKKFEQR